MSTNILKKPSRAILFFLCFALIPIVLTILYAKFKRSGEIEDSNTFSKKIPTEYSNVLELSDKSPGKVIFVSTVVSKFRNPISRFIITDKYYLQVYKMDTLFDVSLKTAIKESFMDAHADIYTPYLLDDITDMKFLYKLTKPKTPKNIYLDLFGDKTLILKKNDTIAYYYSECKNFSIKFNPEDPNDISGNTIGESIYATPLELLFLKKDKTLFLITLSAKKHATTLNPGTLYSLLSK